MPAKQNTNWISYVGEHGRTFTAGDYNPDTITKQWQRSDSTLVPILVAELKSLRLRARTQEETQLLLEARLAVLEAQLQSLFPPNP